ncbi:hypothetical protein GCM10028784_03390 [Myceligenerans cantabricum]
MRVRSDVEDSCLCAERRGWRASRPNGGGYDMAALSDLTEKAHDQHLYGE